MKKLITILLCCMIMFFPMGHAMASSNETEVGGLYSDKTYDGFELSWTNNGKRDILLAATDERGTISFQYDENDYRTSKTDANGKTTYFAYDSAHNLVAVWDGTQLLEYTYDQEGHLSGMSIDGAEYTCELEGLSVHKLVDGEGNVVVEYQYSNGMVSAVYGCTEDGDLVDKTNDAEFVGNLNKVTYNSYYYDEETGWYYCGRYVDVAGRRFVDGYSGSLDAAVENVLSGRASLALTAYNLYQTLINTAGFGFAIDAGPNSEWYDDMSITELLTRLIYGENPYENAPYAEHKAVGWVLWNRKVKAGYGGDTLWDVATNGAAFSSIYYASDASTCPDTTSVEWESATLVACYLRCAENGGHSTSELEAVMSRPTGITANHTFFMSYKAMYEKLQNGFSYNSAVIADYGSIGTTAASLRSAYTAYINQIYEEEEIFLETGSTYVGKVNIFYTP